MSLSARDNLAAALWAMAGTLVFSLIYSSGKFHGVPGLAFQILFFRYIGGILTVALLTSIFDRNALAVSTSWKTHLLRAFCGSFGGCAMIFATADLPISVATAIGQLEPFFGVVFALLFLAERVYGAHWLAILVGLAGTLIIVFSDGLPLAVSSYSPVSLAAALASAILLAAEGIFIKLLSKKDSRLSILLHVNVFAAAMLFPIAYFSFDTTTTVEKLTFCLLGPFAIFGQFCFIQAYSKGDVAVVAPAGYSWIIFSIVIGALFFGEMPTLIVLAGALLIVLSGILIGTMISKTNQ